jgi:hypothetical protein
MTPFEFIKLIFGVWYIAHAVTGTHGPGGLFELMREKLPHGRRTITRYAETAMSRNTLPGLLDCIICFAPWVALALLLVQVEVIRDVLALAGGALLLHSFTGWRFGE